MLLELAVALSTAVPTPQQASAPPIFNVPANLPAATAGTPYTYRFCRPITANACGGPFAKRQTNPVRGAGGPYTFTIRPGGGFVPPGLSLGPRTGILAGTIRPDAAPATASRSYSFVVCARDRSGTTCRPTRLRVGPAAKPKDALLGKWRGTYAYSYSLAGYCLGKTFSWEAPATIEITTSGTAYAASFTLVQGIRDTPACQLAPARPDLTFSLSMKAVTPGTITYQSWALSVRGDTLIATYRDDSNGQVWHIDMTLNRA